MTRARALVPCLVGGAALAFLAAMVIAGSQPVQRQLVRFEAKGVLTSPPENIRKVEVSRGGEQLTAVRTGDKRWSGEAGADLGEVAGQRISMAVQMMHTSGPVREISPEELAGVDTAPFGLDPPRIVARLFSEGPEPVLTARFGGRNPEDFLQYMRIDGDPRTFLMSRFVGEEWAEALNGRLPE